MSGKTEKRKRRLAKQQAEQHMQPNQGQQRQINIIAELEQFVSSYELLTGEKPKELVLIDPIYNLYVQTVQKNAEAFGLNPGFKTEDPTFMGVVLTKKSPVLVATEMPKN